MSKDIDIEKFCKDVNGVMAWMKTGVSIAVGIAVCSTILSLISLIRILP